MIKKIKNIIAAAILPLAIAAPLALAPVAASAANLCSGTIGTGLQSGINSATGAGGSACSDAGSGSTSFQTLAKKVVNLLSVVVGVIAVIMIIVGGFRYITSGGESSNVSTAKNTLVYAIVGLVIVALAQFIVHFVLSNVSTTT